jgi:hypothetical protein
MIVAGTGSSTGGSPSLAFVNGCPAISYYDHTGSVFKYIRATDASGTAWGTPVTLASATSTGSGASLVVVNGNPAVSYCGGSFDLLYMRANDADGAGWGAAVTLDSTGSVGGASSLAVLNGRPAIAYSDVTNGDLKYVRAGDANGTSWGTPVTVDNSVNNVGWSKSLGIVRGKPAIGYTDFTSKDVKYVRANDANGTSWGTPLLVASAGEFSLGSMVILNGNPAISYYEDLDWNLKSALLVYPPTPEIAVEQPAGNTLNDGTGIQFGSAGVGGSSAAFTFTITNPGTADLSGLAISKDGTNAGDFTVSVLSGAGIPVGAGTVTFTVSFTPGGTGPKTAAIHIASNVSGSENPFDITLSGTGLTLLENWRQTFYGTTANTGNAANTADPYHTGVQNLAVFAELGPNQDPAKVAAGLLPQPQILGGNYVITFTQPAGVSGVTYGAQWRADLSSGTWTPIGDTGSGTTHTFSVPVAGNPQIFLRLTVSSP